jgi:hypothetical protein
MRGEQRLSRSPGGFNAKKVAMVKEQRNSAPGNGRFEAAAARRRSESFCPGCVARQRRQQPIGYSASLRRRRQHDENPASSPELRIHV